MEKDLSCNGNENKAEVPAQIRQNTLENKDCIKRQRMALRNDKRSQPSKKIGHL